MSEEFTYQHVTYGRSLRLTSARMTARLGRTPSLLTVGGDPLKTWRFKTHMERLAEWQHRRWVKAHPRDVLPADAVRVRLIDDRERPFEFRLTIRQDGWGNVRPEHREALLDLNPIDRLAANVLARDTDAASV